MTEVYLLKVSDEKILVPRPTNVKNDEIIEVTVNRVFADEEMKKRIEKKGVVRIY